IHANIAGGSNQRFAGVQPHSYTPRVIAWPGVSGEGTLRRCRILYGIQGASEGDTECIALCSYFSPVPLVKRGAQNRVMLCQRRCEMLSQLIEEIGRPFDVGEEKGYGAGELHCSRARGNLGSLEQAIIECARFSGRVEPKLLVQLIDTTLV